MFSNSSNYPDSKDKFQNNKGPDPSGKIITEALHELVVCSSMGAWVMLKSLFSIYAPLTLFSMGLAAWAGYYISTEALHIKFVHDIEPSVFTYERLSWMYKIHRDYYWICFSLILYTPAILTFGLYARSIRTKYQLMFQKLGIRNGVGDTPKLLRRKRIDSERTKYIFDANGIGLSEFESKKERLESHFQQNIESITTEKNKGRIEISLNKQDFPEKITYEDMAKKNPLKKGSFFVGHSVEGVISQNVAKLPHMMMAGVTDSGKSVFFKQALVGLLESTPHLQVYLIDLKGGLEMVDFVKAPNVRFVKTPDEALKLLRQVEREMKARFKYLEQNGRKVIVPEEDKKDRIIVGVDEASVLYATPGVSDPDRNLVLEARKLTDSIAKLSRAASIHLLLATQKVEGQVIPTTVSENITGRMMFRSNSFQGSNQMLGSKEAMDLPKIPGRGIWSCGTTKLMIQAPFIDEKTIVKRCEVIAEKFESGEQKCFNPMIGDAESKEGQEMRQAAYDVVEKNEDEQENNTTDDKGDAE